MRLGIGIQKIPLRIENFRCVRKYKAFYVNFIERKEAALLAETLEIAKRNSGEENEDAATKKSKSIVIYVTVSLSAAIVLVIGETK
jgi:hypothetical protein